MPSNRRKTRASFPYLEHAPIVEAVVDLRAPAAEGWQAPVISERVGARLPEYVRVLATQQFHAEGPADAQNPNPLEPSWSGLRYDSRDKRNIAQFNRDGFVFSRLAPYENWEKLSSEALRLWRLYLEVAQPPQVRRVGVRYINRIILPAGERGFEKFIRPHPRAPRGMPFPFLGFFQNEMFLVPDEPYVVTIVRTVQQLSGPEGMRLAIILDIDAQTTGVYFSPSDTAIEQRLSELRVLKNKAFFGSVTERALEMLR